MKTKEEYKSFIKDGYEIQKDARKQVIEILKEKGAQEWDWENDSAPSIISTQFEDDVTDCYVKKIYVEGDNIYADLHAYYIGEDNHGLDLTNDECNIDWLDILDWVVDKVL